ncbi:MAG: GntR family transcriptional regulator [Trueperaceae bacterium]|nr:MAG: GntR family transcriptional regulator [Trueperaceae bacterium]
MKEFPSLETKTLRENVTNIIRDAIIEGKLAADSELNQAQLADQLGISRGPVREALGQLEQEGLIRNIPYKGVYVTSLTPGYVQELFSLRSVLELFAVRQAIARKEPSDLEQLRALVVEMAEAAKEEDTRKLVELDLAFHRTLINLSGHDLLRKTWNHLEIGLKRCLFTRHKIYESLEEVVGSHPELIAAITSGETEQACRILETHILEAGDMICRHWYDNTGDQKEAIADDTTANR